jgi:hypothetical protein
MVFRDLRVALSQVRYAAAQAPDTARAIEAAARAHEKAAKMVVQLMVVAAMIGVAFMAADLIREFRNPVDVP